MSEKYKLSEKRKEVYRILNYVNNFFFRHLSSVKGCVLISAFGSLGIVSSYVEFKICAKTAGN